MEARLPRCDRWYHDFKKTVGTDGADAMYATHVYNYLFYSGVHNIADSGELLSLVSYRPNMRRYATTLNHYQALNYSLENLSHIKGNRNPLHDANGYPNTITQSTNVFNRYKSLSRALYCLCMRTNPSRSPSSLELSFWGNVGFAPVKELESESSAPECSSRVAPAGMVVFPPPSFVESRLPSAAALARRTSSADTASPKRFGSLPRRSPSTRGPVRLDRLLKFTMTIVELFLASRAYSVETRRLCCRYGEGSGSLSR